MVSEDVPHAREVASRVARWLVQKDRPMEAVAVLSAWAARGPNDAAGQALLAEALRIDPGAKEPQQAFERMEGLIDTDQSALELALEQFSWPELEKLERSLKAPTFRRAQMGFNNNIRAKDQVFHVQTEDSGLDAPHIITHLFADGGRVIKSHKRNYAESIHTEVDIGAYVKQLMKAQHLEMVVALRDGQFDEILAGRAVGGMEVLEHPPDVDLSKLGGKGGKAAKDKAERVAAAAEKTATAETAKVTRPESEPPPEPAAAPKSPLPVAPAPPRRSLPPPLPGGQTLRGGVRAPQAAPTNTLSHGVSRKSGTVRGVAPPPPKAATKELFTLHVLRSLGGGPGRYAVGRRKTVIGKAGDISLPGEPFCHPREAGLEYVDGRLWLSPLDGHNGVFLRIHKPVAVQFGEEFIVGDQLLRIEDNPISDDAPDPAPTYFYSSPRWPSAFRLVQIFEGGARGACLVARGSTLQVGSVMGDLILSDDPLVEAQHCVVEEQAGTLVLSDLDSRNGVFLRTRGRQELVNGDEIVIGRTHLVVALTDPTR